MNSPSQVHKTVLLKEAINGLQVVKGGWYVDATFGRGGHTDKILAKGANCLAFDWDTEAISYGTAQFAAELENHSLILVHANFEHLLTEIEKFPKIRSKILGVLFDFGTSTEQLTSSARGFSVHEDGPLDMRMDTRLGVQAKDLLAVIPENQLADLFKDYGGEEEARAIARAIKKSIVPIQTTSQLRELILKIKRRQSGHLHPATKVFQALRIAVNSELSAIEAALPQALSILSTRGRIVTIAFHDGEDRIAKSTFREWQQLEKGNVLTPKPITPSSEELAINPRARSAKLRIFEKS